MKYMHEEVLMIVANGLDRLSFGFFSGYKWALYTGYVSIEYINASIYHKYHTAINLPNTIYVIDIVIDIVTFNLTF